MAAQRVPASVRSQVRVGYRVDGNAVILYAARSAFRAPAWPHRDLEWHADQALPASSSFAKLLDEVDADPTGIFRDDAAAVAVELHGAPDR